MSRAVVAHVKQAPVAIAIACATMLWLVAADLPRAAPRSVTFRTDDGVTLTGTWYEPSTRPAPVVVLVHMLHRTRRDWDSVAALLSTEGIGALTFDLRGHGESQGAVPPDGQYQMLAQDVLAARRFAASRPDVTPAHVGLLGASLGANLAVLSAAQTPGVASIALLSASTEYRGVRIDAAIKKYAGRTLFVVSDDDPYAQRSAKELTKASGRGSARETLVLSHAGHGTTMLSRDPTLGQSLVDWFRRTLQ